MYALISGIAARAVFIEGQSVSYIDLDSPEESHTCSHAEIGILLADASDITEIKHSTRETALQCLQDLWCKDRSVRMLQLVLEDDEEFRQEALEYFDDLLRKNTEEWLLNRVLAWPSFSIPDRAKIDAFAPKWSRARSFVTDLLSLQSSIKHVRSAWDEITDAHFDNVAHRSRMEKRAIEKGVFRQFVEAHRNQVKLNDAVLAGYVALASHKNSRAIIQAWESNIGVSRVKSAIHHLKVDLSEEEDALSYEMTELGLPSREAYERVKRSQEGIIEKLKRGDVATARKFAQQLVDEQISRGGSRYAAKTLCNLAQEAKKLGHTSIRLEWVQRAPEVNPDDAWAFGQAGDAFLELYRYPEAETYYKKTIEKGDGQFGAVGLARILKKSFKLEEALHAFRDALEKFPNHREAYRCWAGIGEVLRDMGKPDEALRAYSDAIKLFPDEDVLWCGRAATLKDLGCLDDALSAYEVAREKFPHAIHAWAGLADLFKVLGQFDNALSGYDKVIDRFADEPIGYCGRADVLREKGEFQSALAAYNDVIAKFEYEPMAYGGKAEALRDFGRLDEALEAYDRAVQRFAFEPYLRNGRANLLKVRDELPASLRAYDENVRDFPCNLVALIGRANLLKELGHFDKALEAFDDIESKRPEHNSARYAKAAVLTILARFDEALALLPRSEPRTREEWIAYHVKGMLYLRSGRREDALDIFTKGLLKIEFHKERKYFQYALATAKLANHEYKEALGYVKDGSGPVAAVLQMHSSAALGDKEAASDYYRALVDEPRSNIVFLSHEIARRFQLSAQAPAHDENWIFEREAEAVLAIAA